MNNITSSLIITLLVIVALIFAKPIIVPFVIALLIWFIDKKTRNLIDNIGFVHKYIPMWVKTIAASFTIFGLLLFIGQLLTLNIENLSGSYEEYASNVGDIAKKINAVFGININEEITKIVQDFEFTTYLESFFESISELLGSMVMIIFYTVFLFIEETLFQRKIKLIFSENGNLEAFQSTMSKIDKSLSSYISLKSLIALLTSTLSYFILLGVGIDSPMFWAFLIFMFNFIPSVGPILGTLLPALFSLLQFGEFTPFLIVLISLGVIAVLVGSLVEPRLMGNTLNISPLVAILSLAVWGAIWGIVGMLLSVPITVTMIIIFSQFKSTRNIAILLSEKGKV
ncbi:MAG: AI-2E family transporter [Crocinitomicaceae bacterium]|nr:AI-2E family transporter [Crocinitomicaceae bacterium]